MPTLRVMGEADLDRVAEINQRSFPNPWSRELLAKELSHTWSTVLLAEEGPELCGFLVLWKVYDELHILNVATAPAFRRRGIARQMLTEAHRLAVAQGAAMATLEVRASNKAAQALYEAMGYKKVGLRPDYYQAENEDALIMSRPLP